MLNTTKTSNITLSDFLYWSLQNKMLCEQNDKILKEYYNAYKGAFSNYIKYHINFKVSFVENIINNNCRTLNLLDIGSGCGTEALWFALCGFDVYSIDIASDRLEVAQERLEVLKNKGLNLKVKFDKKSIFSLPDHERYDVIWMNQSFHHIEPRIMVFKKISRLLKKNGVVVISESNGYNIFSQIRLFLKRGIRTKKIRTDIDGSKHLYGVERITIPRYIEKKFKKNGVEPVDIIYHRLSPFKNISPKFIWLESKIQNKIWPISVFFIYIGKKYI